LLNSQAWRTKNKKQTNSLLYVSCKCPSFCEHSGGDVPSNLNPNEFVSEISRMKIALASDHAGFAEKERIKPLLMDLGLDVDDLGTVSEEAVDYPDYARKVAEAVAGGQADQGLLVCGSGTGMAITANKVSGVRAAVAWSEETARLARQHNDANVLAIGARTTPPDQIPAIVRAWFNANFDGGHHADRVRKIEG
jgi:ribose 5-phosphate isomerase B